MYYILYYILEKILNKKNEIIEKEKKVDNNFWIYNKDPKNIIKKFIRAQKNNRYYYS